MGSIPIDQVPDPRPLGFLVVRETSLSPRRGERGTFTRGEAPGSVLTPQDRWPERKSTTSVSSQRRQTGRFPPGSLLPCPVPFAVSTFNTRWLAAYRLAPRRERRNRAAARLKQPLRWQNQLPLFVEFLIAAHTGSLFSRAVCAQSTNAPKFKPRLELFE